MEKDYKELEALNKEYAYGSPKTLNKTDKEELERLRATVKKYYNNFEIDEDMKNELREKNEVLMSLRAKNADLEKKLTAAESQKVVKNLDEICKNRKTLGLTLINPEEHQLQIVKEMSIIEGTMQTLNIDNPEYHRLVMEKLKLQQTLNSLLMVKPEIPDSSREEDDIYALKPINQVLEPNLTNVTVEDCSGGGQYSDFQYFPSNDSDYYDEYC